MANIFSDETMELEELFASDKSNMRKRHIEFAKRDYEKLKQLGYVRTPSELKLNEYLWVDVLFYLKPRIRVVEIDENLEFSIMQHPNGLWTYGVSVSMEPGDGLSCPGFLRNYIVRRTRRMIRLLIA